MASCIHGNSRKLGNTIRRAIVQDSLRGKVHKTSARQLKTAGSPAQLNATQRKRNATHHNSIGGRQARALDLRFDLRGPSRANGLARKVHDTSAAGDGGGPLGRREALHARIGRHFGASSGDVARQDLDLVPLGGQLGDEAAADEAGGACEAVSGERAQDAHVGCQRIPMPPSSGILMNVQEEQKVNTMHV